MCGRFSLALDASALHQAFPGFSFPLELRGRYNIAPSQPILTIANEGAQKAEFMLWGLVPAWAKDTSRAVINARAETLGEKPTFRGPFKYHRCLIPADGFYEWKKTAGSKGKTPYYFQLAQGQPFAFAGLWDEWKSADGSSVRTCAIVTTSANALIADIHQRMPVILAPDAYASWLAPEPRKPEELEHLLQPFEAEKMTARAISSLINSPSNEGPVVLQSAD